LAEDEEDYGEKENQTSHYNMKQGIWSGQGSRTLLRTIQPTEKNTIVSLLQPGRARKDRGQPGFRRRGVITSQL